MMSSPHPSSLPSLSPHLPQAGDISSLCKTLLPQILIMRLMRNKIFLWLGQGLFSPICHCPSQRDKWFWLQMFSIASSQEWGGAFTCYIFSPYPHLHFIMKPEPRSFRSENPSHTHGISAQLCFCVCLCLCVCVCVYVSECVCGQGGDLWVEWSWAILGNLI